MENEQKKGTTRTKKASKKEEKTEMFLLLKLQQFSEFDNQWLKSTWPEQ
jgi:hypothetical protein